MSTAREEASRGACDATHRCITCSDEATPMRVIAATDHEIAVCEDERGAQVDVLIGLVAPVAVGDRLLVHAGAALVRVDPAPRRAGEP